MKNRVIQIGLDGSGIDEAIEAVRQIQSDIETKTAELVERLSEMGMNIASIRFESAQYDGVKDVDVRVEVRDENCRAVVATGETALILEFGAGVLHGYGHPEAAQAGMGPTTYPGQVHAADPHGWYLPKDVQAVTGRKKSYGNAPSEAMYNAAKSLETVFERTVREVFGSA